MSLDEGAKLVGRDQQRLDQPVVLPADRQHLEDLPPRRLHAPNEGGHVLFPAQRGHDGVELGPDPVRVSEFEEVDRLPRVAPLAATERGLHGLPRCIDEGPTQSRSAECSSISSRNCSARGCRDRVVIGCGEATLDFGP